MTEFVRHNIIIISSIDWTTHWQMHQQLATSLVESGNRVLFIDNTGARTLKPGDLGRVHDRIRNWFKSTRGFREIKPGLTVFSPIFLPFPYSRLALWVNRIFLSKALAKWMSVTRFHDPVVFTFMPTPLAQALIEDVDPVLVVYYCANDMAGSSPAVRKLRPWEDMMFRKADMVFVISEAIRERALKHTVNVYLFPPGVDSEKFGKARQKADVPDDLKGLSHPIVGYIGSLSDVLDQELIVDMAARFTSGLTILLSRLTHPQIEL